MIKKSGTGNLRFKKPGTGNLGILKVGKREPYFEPEKPGNREIPDLRSEFSELYII